MSNLTGQMFHFYAQNSAQGFVDALFAKLSEFTAIYDRLITQNHFLRKFNTLVDFSFIQDELEHKYCLNNGRNARITGGGIQIAVK